MAVILLYDPGAAFREKLLAVLESRQDFLIKTQYGSDDTLPGVLLDLLYRSIVSDSIEEYDLRSWTDGSGKFTICGTYEGGKPASG